MALTINHQTNDISATSGSMTIDGASAGGPSTTYGDVGTYIMGARIQGRVTEGSTAAGSSIRNITIHGWNSTSISFNTTLNPPDFVTSDTMSGTWRQMFDATIGNSSDNARGGIWVRIS